jgi:hypothetical protein
MKKPIKFEDLHGYIEAYQKNSNIAVVPYSLVASYFDVTSAGIAAMERSGRLQGVRIGRNPFILLESILQLERNRENEVLIVEEFLKKLAKAKQRSVFYEPIMEKIGLDWRVPADRSRIGSILGEISERTAEVDKRQKLMLTVLVHRKTAGVTRPGKGFFDLARDLGHTFNDEDEFVRRHTDKVIEAFG